MSLDSSTLEVDMGDLLRAISALNPALVWVDSRHQKNAMIAATHLEHLGHAPNVVPLCGRSFEDQVWWKRWVVLWEGKSKPHQFPGTCADEEPITPIPRGFSLD